MIALLDNTVMSNFSLVERPDLLRTTFGDEVATPQQAFSELIAGEAACLAMAIHRGCRIVTDDRDAREFAYRLRIPLSGTLGVLVRLMDIESLSLEQADALLSRMIAAGYRSPAVSLQELR